MPDKEETSSSLAVAAVMVFTILPYPAIWYGMNVMRDAASTLALYHGLVLLPPVVLAFPAWRAGLKVPNLKHVGVLLVASVLFCGCTLLLYHLMSPLMLSDEKTSILLQDQGYSKQSFLPLSLYFVTVNPLLEELFWRGTVINKLEPVTRKIKNFGIIWSSFWYGAFHYPILAMVLYPGWSELGAVMLMIYGALLALYYRKTESIILPAIAHGLLTDLSAIALIIALFRRLPPV